MLLHVVSPPTKSLRMILMVKAIAKKIYAYIIKYVHIYLDIHYPSQIDR